MQEKSQAIEKKSIRESKFHGVWNIFRRRTTNTPEEAEGSRALDRPLHPTRGTPQETKDGSKDHPKVLLAYPLSGCRRFL